MEIIQQPAPRIPSLQYLPSSLTMTFVTLQLFCLRHFHYIYVRLLFVSTTHKCLAYFIAAEQTTTIVIFRRICLVFIHVQSSELFLIPRGVRNICLKRDLVALPG